MNVMSVAQANDKWCCQFNEAKCCAYECMAWRWEYVCVDPGGPANMWPTKPAKYEYSNERGYCGLAGKP